VGDLRIVADNGGVWLTQANGSVFFWGPSSLMNRDVRFEIQDDSNHFDSIATTLHLSRGGKATVAVRRRS